MGVRTTLTGAMALLALGAEAAQAEVKFQFWYSAGEQVILTLIERFEARNPDIEIEPVNVGNYGNAIVRLQAAAASGDVPALAQIEITRYGMFAAAGALEPLDARLAADPTVTSDLRPFARDAALYLGQSYVLPFNVSNLLMYYNKDHFREAGLDPDSPPRNWEELLSMAQSLTIRDGDTVTQWGVNTPPQWGRWAMANQAGGGWMDPTTNENLMGRPETARAYQFAADLVNVHKVAQIDANASDLLTPSRSCSPAGARASPSTRPARWATSGVTRLSIWAWPRCPATPSAPRQSAGRCSASSPARRRRRRRPPGASCSSS